MSPKAAQFFTVSAGGPEIDPFRFTEGDPVVFTEHHRLNTPNEPASNIVIGVAKVIANHRARPIIEDLDGNQSAIRASHELFTLEEVDGIANAKPTDWPLSKALSVAVAVRTARRDKDPDR